MGTSDPLAIRVRALMDGASETGPPLPLSRQAALYGEFMQKVRTGQPFTIACRGDSITYGQDSYASDRLPPLDGHTLHRAPTQYPGALAAHLNVAYGGAATVINQGYSGDWAKRSYERWPEAAGSDLTIIGLGINDSRSTASEFPGQISPFIEWYEKIILRELEWGSACMILLPTRQVNDPGSIASYRDALCVLARNYGLPVVDAGAILTGYSDVFSDPTHLNAKGYQILGTRIAMDLIDKASSFGNPAPATGAYYLPVPALYDTSTDITETRIPLQDVLDRLGVSSWANWRAHAPAFKVTVRSYEQAVIEYLLSVNVSPTGASGTAVERVAQLRRTNIAGTPNESLVREINAVTWDAATKELVFAWKTTGKNAKVNFAMTVTLL